MLVYARIYTHTRIHAYTRVIIYSRKLQCSQIAQKLFADYTTIWLLCQLQSVAGHVIIYASTEQGTPKTERVTKQLYMA